MLKLPSIVGLALLWVVVLAQSNKLCPLEEVPQNDFTCNLNGTVQRPTYIGRYKSVATLDLCVKKCLYDTKCHATRYLHTNGACDLYEYHLVNMNFTTEVKTLGVYNDRNCYSMECNTVEACNAIEDCEYESTRGMYFGFQEFGCAYGITAVFDPEAKVHHFNGSFTACEATKACAEAGTTGPFDVHFSLVAEQWICYTDHAFKEGYYYGGISYLENKVGPTTFNVKNSSVGASYVYYESYAYG